MKNVIIVFERPDIASAVALQSSIPDSEVWVFDPHLLDDLVAAGVRGNKYIQLDLNIDMPRNVKDCRAMALSVEREIEPYLKKIVGEAEISCWQHLNWHFLHATLGDYARLWNRFLESEIKHIHFHVLVRDIPATYYAPSFIPPVMLMERMSAAGISFTAYSHSGVTEISRYIPASFTAKNDPRHYDIFSHLPTCIYDSNYYETEIAASGLRVLNFESQNWDVPFQSFDRVDLRHDTEVLAGLPKEVAQGIGQATTEIEVFLTEYFKRFIRTEIYRSRQARHIAMQYRAQMIFYFYLEREFSVHLPRKVVISNHDAGLHGPFLSFAQRHDIPVLMLPHAKIFNWPIPSGYSNIVAVTHPVQGGFISTVTGKRSHSSIVRFPEALTHDHRPPKAIALIGLVLNKFSSDGMTTVDTSGYIAGIRSIMSWCAKNSVSLKIRVKPGGTCIQWLAEALGCTQDALLAGVRGSIGQFASDCDICVMYDAPTSGAIELLRNSIPVIGTVIRALCPEESNIVSTDIVPRFSVTETLDQLDSFRRDEVNLPIFRNEQFGRYVARFSQAKPLRMYI